MCNRFTLSTDKDDLQSRYGFIFPNDILLQPRYNIAPSQNSPIIVSNQGQRELVMMRWGLIPVWAKDIKIGYKMTNARAETLAEKNTFKRPFRDRRCLVLADGFYEWTGDKKNRIPYRFVLKTREPFVFAGLWEKWKSPEGEEILSFTIITTRANELMEPIHNRMPVILHKKDEDVWLDPKFKDTDTLTEYLAPFPSDLMEAYQVSTLVNSPKNDSEECIKPV
ncbi:MAG TPA: SOS response-associated peptidase [Thermodesulfobacteriota bacterium]|nr:SOS response-associated peptidase [Thermodesulfobacteriota bacterium]